MFLVKIRCVKCQMVLGYLPKMTETKPPYEYVAGLCLTCHKRTQDEKEKKGK